MSFSSISFLFLFMGLVCLCYWLIPRQYQTAKLVLLFVAGLLFYTWGDAKALPVYLLSVLFNCFAGAEIGEVLDEEGTRPGDPRPQRAKVRVIFAAAADLAVLALFKYSALAMPVGISFYTFSAMSYLFDVYYGRTEDRGNFLTACFYITFFPKLISGPIVEYKDMAEQIDYRTLSSSDFTIGTTKFIAGLFKKVLIADNFQALVADISGKQTMAAGTAWLCMIYYSLELYFDFSGYSDMAIGLARIFGFQFDENFNYPYLSQGLTDFWRRWHISLGRWFRDYVYIPLGGNRKGKQRQIINLCVVWILTGVWHGSTLNFVFWGIYHGCLIMLERFVVPGVERWPAAVRIFFTDLLVGIGWIFFFCPELGASVHFMGQMFGAGGLGFVNKETVYYFTGNLVLLVAAVICCGPGLKKLNAKITASGQAGRVVSTVLVALLFALTIAYMVGSTYHSFLYFTF